MATGTPTPPGASSGPLLDLVERVAALADGPSAVDDALAAALAEICAFTGWPVGHVLLVRQGGIVGTTIWHGASGPGMSAFRRAGDELRLRAGEGLAGRVLQTGGPAWVADVAGDGGFVRREPALEAGVRRGVAVPLLAGGEMVGVLELFGLEPGVPGDDLLAALQSVCHEVSRVVERGRAEARLRASEQRYRLLFEGATDAILVGDPDGVLTEVNPAACSLLGYAREELVGMDARELCAPEWLDVVDRRVAKKLRGEEEGAVYEMVLLDRTGARIPVEVRSSVLRDGDDVAGIHAVVRDIRERKRAEVALRESEERFRAAFDAAPVGMALSAPDGRWLKVNETLCTMLGYSEDELLASTWQQLTHPGDLAADEAMGRRVLSGEIGSFSIDKRFIRRDGMPVPVRVGVAVVRAEDGSPAYAVAQVLALGGSAGPRAAPACPLSPREREVLSLLARGRKGVEAAVELGIGEETVHTHVRRAMAKLSAGTRAHAVAIALGNGWIEPEAA